MSVDLMRSSFYYAIMCETKAGEVFHLERSRENADMIFPNCCHNLEQGNRTQPKTSIWKLVSFILKVHKLYMR